MDKKKYHFVMTIFVRTYGRWVLNDINIKQFCKEWSELGIDSPLDDSVDQYFHYEYKNWRGI
jgi:hypothetical protein